MPLHAQAPSPTKPNVVENSPHAHARSESPTKVVQDASMNQLAHPEAHGAHHHHAHTNGSCAHGHRHQHANGCGGHDHAHEDAHGHKHGHAERTDGPCAHKGDHGHVHAAHAEHLSGSCAHNHAHEDGHGHKHARAEHTNSSCVHGHKHADAEHANGSCSHKHAHDESHAHRHAHTKHANGTCGHDHAHQDSHAHQHVHGERKGGGCGHDHGEDGHAHGHPAAHANGTCGHQHVHGAGCGHGGTCEHGGVWAYLPHSHGLNQRINADRKSLRWAAAILCCSLTVQLIAGMLVDSSVLQAEAVHTALDGMVIFVSLLSISVATKASTARYTYGFGRAEVLSAMVSVMTLALMCLELGGAALQRIVSWRGLATAAAARKGRFVFLAEAITLVNNLLIYTVLARNDSLNVRALRAHVVGDSLGNVVVLSAGIIMWQRPQAAILDPILTLVVVVGIAALNWPLAKETFDVLMQAAPAAVPVDRLRSAVEAMPDVLSVRSLHVWTLTSGAVVGTLKLFAPHSITDVDALQRVQSDARKLCIEFGVSECTVQVNVARTATSSPAQTDDDEEQGLIFPHHSNSRRRVKDNERYALVGDDDYDSGEGMV